ncbi:MAG TPA: BTAD domain-containing putative transcriptional regulator [Gaiellaceae bacterium]|nr:BTAD domain-containing putative transcriptional regulator [Gaiellaceae bacterium]
MRDYRVLGPLEVEDEGRLLELTGQRQRALLILLLLRANEVVATDRIVDDLWGGSAPRTAPAALHNAIGQLRRVLGVDCLVTRPPGYVLHVERAQVDALRFEDVVRGARATEPAARAAALRDALALWRGAALIDVAYESFAATEASRFEELRLVAREELNDVELGLGSHDALVPELQALVEANPLRERLWGQLMLALYRAGRQGDASQAYQDARHTLLAELGIEPGPALKQLHGAIIRQEIDVPTAHGAVRGSAGADELADVATAILAGRVVPVLGEDAELVVARLAERFHYPRNEPPELPRVSQYAAAMRGYGPLYDELRDVVRGDGGPGAVHRFFASLPPLLRANGVPHQLLVTTSYGLALEQAFAAAGEEVDVVSYIASGRDRGRFCHLSPDGAARVIDVPNTYATELSLERRSVILKIRGQVDPSDAGADSFVVTEDDYIDYLLRADVAAAVPVGLAATLRRSHFLFLGYTVRDWHLRLVLGRMWGDEPVAYRSWAVHPKPGPAERELWRRLDVELAETPLELYVEGLAGGVGVPEGWAA